MCVCVYVCMYVCHVLCFQTTTFAGYKDFDTIAISRRGKEANLNSDNVLGFCFNGGENL